MIHMAPHGSVTECGRNRGLRRADGHRIIAMRSASYFKVIIFTLLLFVVILMIKNGGNYGGNRPSEHRNNFKDEGGKYKQEGESDLPCCKWDENLLGKYLDFADSFKLVKGIALFMIYLDLVHD